MALEFERDEKKAAVNSSKHRVSFGEAATVFGDPFSLTYDDPDHSLAEARFITIGLSDKGKVIMVSHTDRGRKVRLISARKATKSERKYYEKKQ